MAAPIIVSVATKAAKKVFFDILTDPGKVLKYVAIIVFLPIFILLSIFVIPIILISSTPVLLFDGGNNTPPDVAQKQMATIAIYQETPGDIENDIQDWIKQQKHKYNWCDKTQVSYSYNLSWQELMSIDSVRLNQDFNKSNREDILKLGNLFIVKNTHVKNVDSTDDEGNPIVKHIAVISVSTKSYDTILNELGFNSYDKQIANNIYNTIADLDLVGNNKVGNISLDDLKEYPPGNADIPYFNQTDRRWGANPYGRGQTIADSGCGPTALAMVVAGLTGRADINPKVVADWSVNSGYCASGYGSYWGLIPNGGKYYGLQVQAVSRSDPNTIVQALSQGNPVIVIMGRGHFTTGGHFIVLRGLSSDGKILVNDPYSVKNTNKAWDLSIIMNESSTSGGVNGNPFWVFSK